LLERRTHVDAEGTDVPQEFLVVMFTVVSTASSAMTLPAREFTYLLYYE